MKTLAVRTVRKLFSAGELLFTEGEPCNGLHIIARGRVSIFMQHPEVGPKVLQVVGSRLRRLVGILEELSFTTIRQRLISALPKLVQNEGKQGSLGIEFQRPAAHQKLANQLGTVRELVSSNLMRLQAEGLLDVAARQIVVKDLDGLKALLETTS